MIGCTSGEPPRRLEQGDIMTTASPSPAPLIAAADDYTYEMQVHVAAGADHRGADRRQRDQPLVDRRDPLRASRRRGAALHGRRRSRRRLHGRARPGTGEVTWTVTDCRGHGRLGRHQAVVLGASRTPTGPARSRSATSGCAPRSSASTSAAPAGTTSCPACTSSSRPAKAARTSRATRRLDLTNRSPALRRVQRCRANEHRRRR